MLFGYGQGGAFYQIRCVNGGISYKTADEYAPNTFYRLLCEYAAVGCLDTSMESGTPGKQGVLPHRKSIPQKD